MNIYTQYESKKGPQRFHPKRVNPIRRRLLENVTRILESQIDELQSYLHNRKSDSKDPDQAYTIGQQNGLVFAQMLLIQLQQNIKNLSGMEELDPKISSMTIEELREELSRLEHVNSVYRWIAKECQRDISQYPPIQEEAKVRYEMTKRT